MDATVATFLCILFFALILFAKELFPLEISALLVSLILVITGILPYKEALESFSNDALFLIGSLFVLTAGLNKTGVIKAIERSLIRIAGKSKRLAYFIMLISVAVISAFVSNTATLAVVIPIVVSISKSFGDSPRRWLLPIALASVIGGMNTLIGTSTNIIISGMLGQYGLKPFSLFTTTQAAYPILLVGMAYLFFVAPYLISERSEGEQIDHSQLFNLRAYTSEFVVKKGSPLSNKKIEDSLLSKDADVIIVGISRGKGKLSVPRNATVIHEGDILLLEGNIKKLNEIKEKYGLEFLEETKSDATIKETLPGGTLRNELKLHEVLVTERSRLKNRTPVEVFLRNRYSISLLAVNRQGETVHNKLRDFRFLAGDILVIQLLRPIDNRTFDFLGLIPLQELERESYRTQLRFHAIGIFLLSLIIGSTVPSIPLSLACLLGAITTVIFGVIKGNELYEVIEWRILIFIASILSLGKAMGLSGAASFLSEVILKYLPVNSPNIAIAAFVLITAIMTQLFSNQATAVILLPLAISFASSSGINPMSLVMAVTLGASLCFLTPLEPVLMMVYGPGRYNLLDFLKVGLVLLVISFFLACYMIPIIWRP
ncbi:MAG: SLC13 family permease [Candidatus Dadabacteria bacterium]|nr:MAG: SLC13 family permease [Candidatus Dadabacteria bacterium]